MKVTVKLFASFREATGAPQSVVEIAPDTTIGKLWADLVEAHPRLRPLSGNAAFALNGRYAPGDAPLGEGDVVAFLPPVSGG
ncbi:MAG: MoaD/ThiS family protein [Chloroflexia bacterium]